MNYYKKTIENLTWYDDKITPTKKALAELSERIQVEIYNEGGDGFIMPFIPVSLKNGERKYLPHRLKDIKQLIKVV